MDRERLVETVALVLHIKGYDFLNKGEKDKKKNLYFINRTSFLKVLFFCFKSSITPPKEVGAWRCLNN
jgi:hypothetical protein